MTPSSSSESRFVVAVPARTNYYNDFARILHRHQALRLLALGTRRGVEGVPAELTRLLPLYGALGYASAKLVGSYRAEAFRFGMLPLLDHWVKRQLQPGDHIISSYGYVNCSFAWVRERGGKTFIDAGNSHPEHYWNLIREEHARWGCPLPPFPKGWYRRAVEMMPLVDYVLSPSSYVTRTFVERGFKPEQMLRSIYTIDFTCFTPAPTPRPANRPLTLISTGSPSLRKGTPYLLDAFRTLRKSHPNARLLLTGPPHPSLEPLLGRWNDLPIEWFPSLPHPQLAEHLRSADIFVLPSLEEGLVRTACEAMACGLPVVLTSHTGANDLVTPGVNGEIVPIRNAPAIVEAVERSFERLRRDGPPPEGNLRERLSYATFEREFVEQLRGLKLLPT